MRFVKGSPEVAAQHIAKRLFTLVKEGKSVLWLVSGGSNAPIQTMAMDLVPDYLSKHIAIIPIDERWGPYNHPESNTAKLRKAGFDPKHAEWIDLLEENLSPADTAKLLNDFMAREIGVNDYIFATLGMGPDGHIAGILPHSPALHRSDLAIYYKANDFTRITLCADAIAAHCNEVVLSVFGKSKTNAIEALASRDDQRENVPVMILKEIDNCTVFNDIVMKSD